MKNKLNVIFLDIDGVLNTVPGQLYWKEYYSNRKIPKYLKYGLAEKLDPSKVALFNRIIKNIQDNGVDVKIVISSSWQCMWNTNKQLFKVLKREGLNVKPMIDCTRHAKLTSKRGHNISWWMDEQEENGIQIEKYLIIDDHNDMLEEQMDSFVQTNSADGLSCEDSTNIVNHFKTKEQLDEDKTKRKEESETLRLLIGAM